MIYSETDEGKVKVVTDDLKPFPKGEEPALPLEAIIIEERHQLNPPK